MSQRSLFCLGWVMAALTVAGCSNSRTTGDLSIGGLQVASIQPNNGGGEVGPATPITVTFAEAVADPTSDNLVVDDGAGPLSGVLEAQPDGLTWRWTALNGLPRGGSITVRVVAGIRGRSGNRLAADVTETFRVRDAAVLATYEVPNGNAAVMVWPNGRRAVSVGASTYEVVIGGLLNRPNTFGGGAIPSPLKPVASKRGSASWSTSSSPHSSSYWPPSASVGVGGGITGTNRSSWS